MQLRARLAIGLTVSTLLVAAIVAVGATALSAWQPSASHDTTAAGAARVGEEVTVIIVAEEDADATASRVRSDTLRWSLIALAVSVVPAIGVGWFAAGRMLGSVDAALADIEATDDERQSRLQEVVHELRTPLAVMGTNLELAAADPELDQEALEFVNAARRAAERMAHTVGDLAGHGRLAVTAGSEPVDISVLVNEMVSENSGPAHARGIHLIVAGTTHTVVPDADRAAVRAAAGNFVANAVRLAPRGSSVSLDWGEVSGWVWLAVGDEGPGLAPRDHARVFERGWRGRHDRDREGDAQAGLGLTIARQLTEAQGGVVTLESEEGAGSTFALWLPLSSDATAVDVADSDGVHPAVRPWIRDLISS